MTPEQRRALERSEAITLTCKLIDRVLYGLAEGFANLKFSSRQYQKVASLAELYERFYHPKLRFQNFRMTLHKEGQKAIVFKGSPGDHINLELDKGIATFEFYTRTYANADSLPQEMFGVNLRITIERISEK